MAGAAEGGTMKLTTRYWGALTTLIYAALLVFLLVPFTLWIGEGSIDESEFEVLAGIEALTDVPSDTDTWWLITWLALLVVSQVSLFLLSVDRKRRRMPPQRRLAVAIVTMTLATGLLTLGAFAALIAAIWGDDIPDTNFWVFVWVWPLLAIIFYVYRAGLSKRLDALLDWLITGSVVELLIAVPCHVIVRQRDTCCAQGISAIGLSTGIAVMLMTLGPGVWFLYQKKLDKYEPRKPADGGPAAT